MKQFWLFRLIFSSIVLTVVYSEKCSEEKNVIKNIKKRHEVAKNAHNECIEKGKSPACALPEKTGPCDSIIKRWFFNSISKKCEKFSWGGCDPNENNFEKKRECNRACSCSSKDVKALGKKLKHAKRGLKKCKKKEEECSKGCNACELPKIVGPCKAKFKKWYFDINSGTCKEFIYGGCDANANNFSTEEECSNECSKEYNICELPKDTGPCDGMFEKWYFDASSGTCSKFNYGGCDGNANNFSKKEECSNECSKEYNICELPKDTGPCKAKFKKWYFDTDSGTCKEFTYGGCRGNANNFSKEKECSQECNICKLPKDTGPCEAYFEKWYFDANSGTCAKFIYGGCEGNANNFSTEKECSMKCKY